MEIYRLYWDGFLTNVEERLNGDAYIDMLENYMIPSVHLLSEK